MHALVGTETLIQIVNKLWISLLSSFNLRHFSFAITQTEGYCNKLHEGDFYYCKARKKEVKIAISMFNQSMFTWLREMAFQSFYWDWEKEGRNTTDTDLLFLTIMTKHSRFFVHAEDNDVCQRWLYLFSQTFLCRVRTIAESERERKRLTWQLRSHPPHEK